MARKKIITRARPNDTRDDLGAVGLWATPRTWSECALLRSGNEDASSAGRHSIEAPEFPGGVLGRRFPGAFLCRDRLPSGWDLGAGHGVVLGVLASPDEERMSEGPAADRAGVETALWQEADLGIRESRRPKRSEESQRCSEWPHAGRACESGGPRGDPLLSVSLSLISAIFADRISGFPAGLHDRCSWPFVNCDQGSEVFIDQGGMGW